jgi:hypothetical protein
MAYTRGLSTSSFGGQAPLSAKMPEEMISTINRELAVAGFTGKGRFSSPPRAYAFIAEILQHNGYEFAEVLTAYDLPPLEGHKSFRLRKQDADNPFSPLSVTNTGLAFAYHQMSDDRYEVVAYLG